MNPKKLNTTRLWKQLHDDLFPRLRFTLTDRAVYLYLLRHTRLEGQLQLHFSMPWLARGLGISTGPIRESVRRLLVLGALRLLHRSKSGHVAEVRLPDEMRAARPAALASPSRSVESRPADLETLDFLKTRALRNSIHLRERGRCFYCLCRTDARIQCLDHVVPRVKSGCNSYRNLVSCCLECNSLKGARPAPDFLRWLYRERRITASELNARLRALDALSSGKLPPPIQHPDTPVHPVYPAYPEPRRELRSAPRSAPRSSPRSSHRRELRLEPRKEPRCADIPIGSNPMPRRGRPPRSRSGL